MYRSLSAALNELRHLPGSDGADPGVVGFSMGGHWALWLAQHPDPPVSATVVFYAARGGDYSALTSPVMTHFAQSDDFVRDSVRRRMEQAIAARGVAYESYEYPGTGHWFAEVDNPAYEPTATERAIDRTATFLSRHAG